MAMNEIVYKLTDRGIAYRVTPYSVCYEARKNLVISFENANYDNLVVTIRVKNALQIRQIKPDENGRFNIPDLYFLPNTTILLDLSALDETDRLIKTWSLEPLKIVKFYDKQEEVLTSLQDYAFLNNRIKSLEHDNYALENKVDELSKQVSELGKMLANLTEVVL